MKIKKQYRFTNFKSQLLFFFLFFLFFQIVISPQPFCAITCNPGNCQSNLATTCQACPTYFVMAGASPNSCNFDTTLTNVKLSKTSSDFTVVPGPTSNCSANYPYYGQYGNNSAIQVTTLTPVTDAHFQIQLIAWMLLIDSWSGSCYVKVQLISTGQSFQIGQSDTSTNVDYCYNPSNQGYARFAKKYTHTDVLSPVKFNVTTLNMQSSGRLGIGNILLVAHLCHNYCKVCTGYTNNVCSDCKLGYFLSGTTCDVSCPSGYGQNPPSNVCIACHAYCLTCTALDTNCTTCKNTIIVGTNTTASQIYKVQGQNACQVICPAGYYPFLATKQCLSCALHCASMTITSQLISSNASLQFSYTFSQAMDFTGFNYANFLSFTCSNASINTVNDFTIVYQMISNTNFKLKLTPKPTKYLTMSNVCTVITGEATNTYQYTAGLNKLGPTVYTSTNCLQWTTPRVNMSISNLLNTPLKYAQFKFTFTSPMDFTGFVYSNFVNLNDSDPVLTLTTDFTVTYTMIDDYNFKLKLTPNPTVYFTNIIFCAISKAQASTSLQFSKDFYKLHTSVYGQQNCLTWSTPKVSMSISNLLNTALKYAQFTFTFTSPMDFTGFVYSNFINLNDSDPVLSLATDFTITYTMIDDYNFKLKLSPNTGVYFGNTIFCAVSLAQATASLQYSKDFYKLETSVYGQENCLTWNIPSVTLTINAQIIAGGMASQFIFTFSEEMNFNGFDYTNFVTNSVNMTDLTLTGNFTITYTQINNYSFKLKFDPTLQTNFSLLQLCSLTKLKAQTLLQLSSNGSPLDATVYGQNKCLVWSIPIPQSKSNFLQSLQKFNNNIEDITTQKGVQQIIKSGVFAFLMPGAQLSSTVLLHNPKISPHLYQGTRFWGSFIYFDVPPYQQSSNRTKYTFVSPDKQILQNSSRRLQTTTTPNTKTNNFINEWKFDRTGHTGFFIFDTYVQLLLIVSAWILIIIGYLYESKCKKTNITKKINTRIIAIFHKIHQIALFYLILSALIQLKNFDNSNYLHTISLIISSVVLFYYLVYELKIFYDMIQYPKARIDSEIYKQFVRKYSFFIAYYRFQQYNDKIKWNWRHFLRPYNYHSLTFVKKALMLICIPIFYEHGLSPVVILTILQLLDVLRFLFTIPYHKFWRNLLYFTLELLLLVFFICSLINQYSGIYLYDQNGLVIDASYSSIYQSSGIFGMYMIFAYNILYVVSFFFQLGIILFTKSSLENMVWSNRNSYYQDLYSHFQQYGSNYRLIKIYTDQLSYNSERRQSKTFRAWVNKLHHAQPIVDLSEQKLKVFKQINQRGDIITTNFRQQGYEQEIEIKIQVFKITDFQKFIRLSNFSKGQLAPKNQDSYIKQQTQSSKNYNKKKRQDDTRSMKNLSNNQIQQQILSFKIQYDLIPVIFKADESIRNKRKDGLHIPKKIKNTIKSDALNPHFQKSLAMTLVSYQMPGTQQIKLSTYFKIYLKDYQKGQKITYKRQDMRQQILIYRGGKKNKISLKQVMNGFPVDWQELQKINLSETQSSPMKNSQFIKRHFQNLQV